MTIQLDIFKAGENRDKGIEQARKHADLVEPGWSERAILLLLDYMAEAGGSFMVEDVRKYAQDKNFLPPPDERAWGHVIRRAAASGYVEAVGFGKTKNKQGHCHPAAIWRQVKRA